MICAVHAMIGGALGSLVRSRSQAFLAGVASHFVADLLPHRDFSVPAEAAMAVAALAVVGQTAGVDSTAFAGALGGLAPDAENLLSRVGAMDRSYFPTHNGLHGKRIKGVANQAALGALAFAVILACAGKAGTGE